MLYVRHIIQVVLTAAFGAGIPERTAVQFPHGLTACRLMQAVYVLRNDGGKLSRSFKFSKFFMGNVRLNAADNELRPVKAVEFGRIRMKKVRTQNGLGRIIPLLMVQAVNAPEVRDAAFGRNPRAAKKNNPLALIN